mmetsp:Transcript_96071/g.311712  ORF Transcript_96071/g.311712 Transcript_96071/m.311712 type:complete len:652 (+) Transcript_96071:57-2012(+)
MALSFMPSGQQLPFGPGKQLFLQQPQPVPLGTPGRFPPTPQGSHGSVVRVPSYEAPPGSARAPSPGARVIPVSMANFPSRFGGGGSAVRVPSYEAAPRSRGASPGPGGPIPVHVTTMPSPLMTHRSGSIGPLQHHPLDSARGNFGMQQQQQQQQQHQQQQQQQPRQVGRLASRSPPPGPRNAAVRAISTPREPMAGGTPTAGMGPPAPANTPRMPPPMLQLSHLQAPMQRSGSAHGPPGPALLVTPPQPGTPHSQRAQSVAPSPQHAHTVLLPSPTHAETMRRLSMPTSLSSTPSVPGPSRSASASGIQMAPAVAVPPFASMEAPQLPPWAQVVPPPTRPEESRRQQDQLAKDRKLLHDILTEVRTVSIALSESMPEQKAESQAEALNSQEIKQQLEAKERQSEQIERQLAEALSELAQKENQLVNAERVAQQEKDRLEAEHKRRQEVEEKCAVKLDQRNMELQQLLQLSEASKKEAEQRILRLEGELARSSEKIDRHQGLEQEARELRCKVAVLEDRLRDCQDQAEKARDAQDQAERGRDARQADRARDAQEQRRLEGENSRLKGEASLWSQRCTEAEAKFTPSAQQEVWKMQSALEQERKMRQLQKPGDILAAINYFASQDNVHAENDRLKFEVYELQNLVRTLTGRRA